MQSLDRSEIAPVSSFIMADDCIAGGTVFAVRKREERFIINTAATRIHRSASANAIEITMSAADKNKRWQNTAHTGLFANEGRRDLKARFGKSNFSRGPRQDRYAVNPACPFRMSGSAPPTPAAPTVLSSAPEHLPGFSGDFAVREKNALWVHHRPYRQLLSKIPSRAHVHPRVSKGKEGEGVTVGASPRDALRDTSASLWNFSVTHSASRFANDELGLGRGGERRLKHLSRSTSVLWRGGVLQRKSASHGNCVNKISGGKSRAKLKNNILLINNKMSKATLHYDKFRIMLDCLEKFSSFVFQEDRTSEMLENSIIRLKICCIRI